MATPVLPVFNSLLLKVASRCNIHCTYCYWFRDASVYEKPPIMPPDVEQAFLDKLEQHLRTYRLERFWILLHGGEPLLFGKRRFVALMDKLDEIAERTGCTIDVSITTNGTLIDEEWAMLFRIFRVSLTLSIDGPARVHDKARIDSKGRGTHAQVVRGLNILRGQNLEPGILAVCDPATEPETVAAYFTNELGLKRFDILQPDATCDDRPPHIAPYFTRLFDLWYDDYAHRGIRIRSVSAMIKALLGGSSGLDSVGYGAVRSLTMLADGTLEPLDVLRIAGKSSTRTEISVFTHTFMDVTDDPVWLEAYEASLNLHSSCDACEYRQACGGGYLPHRWSQAKRYDNPSVYCEDMKLILGHIWKRITPDIHVNLEHNRTTLAEAVSSFTAIEDWSPITVVEEH